MVWYAEDTNSNDFAPHSFRNAWAATMMRPQLRDWLFNKAPPTQEELLQVRSNSPIMHLNTIVRQAEISSICGTSNYHKQSKKVNGQCHFLECGASLGFFFNHDNTDICATALAHFDSVFDDGTILVNRNVVSSFERQVFLLEFCWLVSGALIIRFIPVFLSIRYESHNFSSNENKKIMLNNPHAQMYTFAFVPSDALIIHAFSQTLSEAFLTSSFEAMGVSSRCFRFSQFDTAFQSPCAFCLSRGAPVCSCPAPLRRRTVANLSATMALSVNVECSASHLWAYYTRNLSMSPNSGSYVFNLRKGCRNIKHDSTIVVSGLLPFYTSTTRNWDTHTTLQQQMQGIAGSCFIPYNYVSIAAMLAEGHQSAKRTSDIWNDSTCDHIEPSPAVQFAGFSHPNEHLQVANSISPRLEQHGRRNIISSSQQETAQLAVLLRGIEKQSKRNASENSVKMFRCPFCTIEIRKKKSNLKRHIINKHKANLL